MTSPPLLCYDHSTAGESRYSAHYSTILIGRDIYSYICLYTTYSAMSPRLSFKSFNTLLCALKSEAVVFLSEKAICIRGVEGYLRLNPPQYALVMQCVYCWKQHVVSHEKAWRRLGARPLLRDLLFVTPCFCYVPAGNPFNKIPLHFRQQHEKSIKKRKRKENCNSACTHLLLL